MSFILDKQTLDDLNIFGKRGGRSVYGIYNLAETKGGAVLLEEMFRYPLSDCDKIRKRIAITRYCKENKVGFPFPNEWFDSIEYYLRHTDERTRYTIGDSSLRKKIMSRFTSDSLSDMLYQGVISSIRLINSVRSFLSSGTGAAMKDVYADYSELYGIVNDPLFSFVEKEKKSRHLKSSETAAYDDIIRGKCKQKMQRLLTLLYRLDVYTTLARVAETRGFVFPEVLPSEENILEIEEMYHPQLSHPVSNSIRVDKDSNFIFLTGANMAGKSTFMKTFGLCIFLAHAGFPVPAKGMRFSVKNGMYTTINLPDNLNMGYSHFYAEVLRVRKVAEQVGRVRNMVVIFDELFRGTNVQDAYEATVAITEAFAANTDSMFLISTHIIEAGETLKERCDNVRFAYLPTKMDGEKPVYTYKLSTGITSDRHGMIIIRNEKILDILKK